MSINSTALDSDGIYRLMPEVERFHQVLRNLQGESLRRLQGSLPSFKTPLGEFGADLLRDGKGLERKVTGLRKRFSNALVPAYKAVIRKEGPSSDWPPVSVLEALLMAPEQLVLLDTALGIQKRMSPLADRILPASRLWVYLVLLKQDYAETQTPNADEVFTKSLTRLIAQILLVYYRGSRPRVPITPTKSERNPTLTSQRSPYAKPLSATSIRVGEVHSQATPTRKYIAQYIMSKEPPRRSEQKSLRGLATHYQQQTPRSVKRAVDEIFGDE